MLSIGSSRPVLVVWRSGGSSGSSSGDPDRYYSLLSFMALVIVLSWPFQIAGLRFQDPWVFNALSMIMVGASAWIHSLITGAARPDVWSGKDLRYLILAIIIPVLMYAPVLSGILNGLGTSIVVLALLQSALNTIPAYGEEVGWRSYMFKVILSKASYRPISRMLIHGVLWWMWHIPAIVFRSQNHLEAFLGFIALTPLGVLHANILAILYIMGGLRASVVYHALYTGLRDTLLTEYTGESDLAAIQSLYSAILIIALGLYFMVLASRKLKES